ncbi:indole-3-glycerol phosphate synthase-domain-containing protein [Dipodascopsis tothii]|uniref:indole-3-glycerol phosphate synthase-domain-containing protein n=1 Tax=Dipodascopsis tothii TaxID=44089 RepID=UPI0034CE9D59
MTRSHGASRAVAADPRNVYQLLRTEGAQVEVFRNDEITIEQLAALGPDRIVISPGPGHPSTDAGISRDVIRHFAGKVPIMGVCMGLQCIYSVFGGEVASAGEIVHGKISTIDHDGKGMFKNVPQQTAVTRYHSLAGTNATLPDVLEVSARTEGGIIMGVRHREYTVEGVQFHPESILTEEGYLMIANFMKMSGGRWAGAAAPAAAPAGGRSILDEIFAVRRADVAAQKLVPGATPADLATQHALGLAPPLIDFAARLRQAPVALLSEIKRASPSKGNIDLAANAPAQARLYASAGAAAISVLTEPHYFKGSLDDMRQARAAVDGLVQRPAILRKEFVFDEYQILEARLAGADTVLLIVKMLDEPLLRRLYAYSKSLGMEPLVEVNSAPEMERALALGAKVIGVNNRDLHSFAVDLGTTSSLVSMVPADTILCALSGISSRADVDKYRGEGVRGFLIGEALMRATDTVAFIHELTGLTPAPALGRPLVKICGTRSAAAATAAVDAGADIVGMILVPGSKRTVAPATAKAIVAAVKAHPRRAPVPLPADWFGAQAALVAGRGPLVAGVFKDQPLEEVLAVQAELGLDLVQLHGSEPLEWARLIPVPVIKKFGPADAGLQTRGYHAIALVDGGAGGEGVAVDWAAIPAGASVLLAGGLTPANAAAAAAVPGVLGVDVSSGVETAGEQDVAKIAAFVAAARA